MGVVPGLGNVGVDIVEDLDLESLQDLQPPSLLTHQVQCAEGERNPDIPGKDFFNSRRFPLFPEKIPHIESLLGMADANLHLAIA